MLDDSLRIGQGALKSLEAFGPRGVRRQLRGVARALQGEQECGTEYPVTLCDGVEDFRERGVFARTKDKGGVSAQRFGWRTC